MKELYIQTGGNINDFESQFPSSNADLFDLKGNGNVVVKNNASKASLRSFKNDIDNCYVEVDRGNIKYRKLLPKKMQMMK